MEKMKKNILLRTIDKIEENKFINTSLDILADLKTYVEQATSYASFITMTITGLLWKDAHFPQVSGFVVLGIGFVGALLLGIFNHHFMLWRQQRKINSRNNIKQDTELMLKKSDTMIEHDIQINDKLDIIIRRMNKE